MAIAQFGVPTFPVTDNFQERAVEASNNYLYTAVAKFMLLWVHVAYTSDVNAGNRQIVLSLGDGVDVYMDTHAGAVQAAGLTRHYHFMPGIYRETAFLDTEIEVPFASLLIVPDTWELNIFDEAGISAGDSMVVTFQGVNLI